MRSRLAGWVLGASAAVALVPSGRAHGTSPAAPSRPAAERFVVLGDGSEDEHAEWSAVLEETGEHVDDLLAIRPDRGQEPARVRVFDDPDAWRLRMDREEQPRLEGWDRLWYGADTDTIYLLRQPTSYETREQLIFGAVLQRFATRQSKNKDGWRSSFAIGFALHLSHHRFVDGELELGVTPMITTADYTAQALLRFDPNTTDAHLDLEEHSADWRVGFALTRFALLGGDRSMRSRFMKLGLGKSGSKLNAGAAIRLFGEPRELAPRVRAFLLEHQEPWRRHFGDWAPIGERAFEGITRAGAIGCATLKEPVARLGLRCEPGGAAFGSLVVDYVDVTHYDALHCFADRLEHARQRPEGYEIVASVPRDPSQRVELVRASDHVEVRIAESTAFELSDAGTGAWGVAVTDGRVEFQDVEWN